MMHDESRIPAPLGRGVVNHRITTGRTIEQSFFPNSKPTTQIDYQI